MSDSTEQPATAGSTDAPAPTSEYVSPLKLDKPEVAEPAPAPAPAPETRPGGGHKPIGDTKRMVSIAAPSGSHKPVPDTKQFVPRSTFAKT